MPNGLHTDSDRNSYSPREMAVDVEFHRQEEQRWKRHSIAEPLTPSHYDENSPPPPPPPTRPTSMLIDENIPEQDDDGNIENTNPIDNQNNNNRPVAVETQYSHRDHLCRRKSKSISNFGEQVLTSR